MSAGKYRRFSPERTIGNDPGVRQSLDRRRDLLLTAFADDDKGMDAGCWAVEHGNSIGEYTANICAASQNPDECPG